MLTVFQVFLMTPPAGIIMIILSKCIFNVNILTILVGSDERYNIDKYPISRMLVIILCVFIPIIVSALVSKWLCTVTELEYQSALYSLIGLGNMLVIIPLSFVASDKIFNYLKRKSEHVSEDNNQQDGNGSN